MKTKIIQNIKAIILGLIIAVGVGYAAAAPTDTGVWTPPDCLPPNCNAFAPINVSDIGQIKLGTLAVGGLGIVGNFSFLPSATAIVKSGQILVADGTTGKVKWGGPGDITGLPDIIKKTINDSYPTINNGAKIVRFIPDQSSVLIAAMPLIAPGGPDAYINSSLTTLDKICSMASPETPYNLSYGVAVDSFNTYHYSLIGSTFVGANGLTSVITVFANAHKPFSCTDVPISSTP